MNYKLKKAAAMMGIFIIFSVGFMGFLERTSVNASAAETDFPVGYVSYVVKRGDSLWSIAEDNMPADGQDIGTFVKELKLINMLQSDYIYDGQLLAVPCYRETAVASAG